MGYLQKVFDLAWEKEEGRGEGEGEGEEKGTKPVNTIFVPAVLPGLGLDLLSLAVRTGFVVKKRPGHSAAAAAGVADLQGPGE